MIKLTLNPDQLNVLYSYSITINDRNDGELDSLVEKLNAGETELTKREFLPLYHYYMSNSDWVGLREYLAKVYVDNFKD